MKNKQPVSYYANSNEVATSPIPTSREMILIEIDAGRAGEWFF